MRQLTNYLIAALLALLVLVALIEFWPFSNFGLASVQNLQPGSPGEPLMLEARQIILPEGHPEFPLDTAWVVVMDQDTPVEVPFPLTIPASWQNRYALRIEGSTAYYDFSADPAAPAPIFSISALTESEWQAIQNEPHGELLFAYQGIVWVYNPALENPYDDQQADAFSQMVGEAYEISRSLPGYFAPELSEETALPVLEGYLAALAAGHYDQAAWFFGGDIDVLLSQNPELSPTDQAALFEAACTVNGYICNLKLKEVLKVDPLNELPVYFP